MSPQELHATLWQILKFRDDVRRLFLSLDVTTWSSHALISSIRRFAKPSYVSFSSVVPGGIDVFNLCLDQENTIEKIPGLSALVEKITTAVNKVRPPLTPPAPIGHGD